MLVDVTSMMASVGSSILGSGTSSTQTSRLPCQVTAFIARFWSLCSTAAMAAPPHSPAAPGAQTTAKTATSAIQITARMAEISERRAIIDRAQAMLSLPYEIDDAAAFEVLCWPSQQTNSKLRALAEQLVAEVRRLSACAAETMRRVHWFGVIGARCFERQHPW
jgi:hypothetical protein